MFITIFKKILSLFPVVSQLIQSRCFHTISGKSSLIFSHLHQGLPSGLSFLQAFPPKPCMFLSSPHMPHAQFMSSSLILSNQPTNQKTNQLTPWCRLLPEKLTGPQPVTKFPALYGMQRFTTTFTKAHYLILS